MTTPTIAIIGVPSSAGARRSGQEKAPAALRALGLVPSLRARGLEVVDRGDLPGAVYRPDPDNPRSQNADLVCRVAREVAGAVDTASASGAFPFILGGDCTITIGVLAGLLHRSSSLGLLYLDGDLDLNTPDTTASGAFDGMVAAHILGRGHPPLARLGPRCPLLEESHLVFFGYNEAGGGIDPPERAALERSSAMRYPVEDVRPDPFRAARAALTALEGRVERILVHFDVDVTDTTAVDVPHEHALPLATAASVLETFLASPKCVGLVVAEFNPQLDAEAAVGRRLVESVAVALGVGLGSRPPTANG